MRNLALVDCRVRSTPTSQNWAEAALTEHNDGVLALEKHLPTMSTQGTLPTKEETTESEFRYREQIRYGRSKTIRRGLRNA